MSNRDNPYDTGAGEVNITFGGLNAGSDRSAAAGAGASQTAPQGTDVIKDVSTASFAADVIQESRRQPVLVDFWAPWCGPCKQLTPMLEKVVARRAGA